MKRFVLFLFACVLLPLFVAAQDITGSWYGLLDVSGAKLRLTIHVQSTESGLSATFDSPDQGASGIPLSVATYADGKFFFSFEPAGLEYHGEVNASFTNISGDFSQGGQEFDLKFGRVELDPPEGGQPWASERLSKREVYIPMRDGKRLFTSIYGV